MESSLDFSPAGDRDLAIVSPTRTRPASGLHPTDLDRQTATTRIENQRSIC